MDRAELQNRTKQFALRVMKLTAALPETVQGRAIANQLMRSGTSVGANYRAACRARSRKEFIAKMGVVIEEADESAFWLELVIDGHLNKADLVQPLLAEADELLRIMSASRTTAIRRGREQKPDG